MAIDEEVYGPEDWESYLRPDPTTLKFNLYNITNAFAVQTVPGTKPILEEHAFEVLEYRDKFDVSVAGDAITYQEHVRYECVDDDACNEPIVTINAVYATAVADTAGSESLLGVGVIPEVVSNFEADFSPDESTQPAYLASFLRLFLVPVYMEAALTTIATEHPNFNMQPDPAGAVVFQWATKGVLAGDVVANTPGFEGVTGFETIGVSMAAAQYVWNSTAEYSPTNTAAGTEAGTFAWVSAMSEPCDAQCMGARQLLVFVFSGIPGVTDAAADFNGVKAWYQALAGNGGVYGAAYLGFMSQVLPATGLVRADTVITSWSDVTIQQFVGGTISKQLGLDSIIPLGLLPLTTIVEFYGWQAGEGIPEPNRVVMDNDQGRAFFGGFKQIANVATFAAAAAAAAAGDNSLLPGILTDPTFFSMGITAENFSTYAGYVMQHLPLFFNQEVLFGELQADGTGSLNGGLFVRRSGWEIVFGYDRANPDPLTPVYDGLLGPIMTLAEARAGPDFYYSQNRGTADITRVNEYVLYENKAQFVTREDLGYECPAPGNKYFGDCNVYTEPEVIRGSLALAGVQPFREDEPLESYMIYVSQIYRSMRVELSGDVEVKGITMRRYRLDKSQIRNDARNEFVDKYRMAAPNPSGFIPLETAVGGAPLVVSLPHFLDADENEKAKFEGLTAEDWEMEDDLLFGVFVDVEPLSGVTMNAALRLQFNWQLNAARYDGGNPLHDNLFATADSYIWPQFWVEKGDTINDDDAKSFREKIYGNRETADTLTVVGLALGITLVVVGMLGVVLCYKLDKAAAAQDAMGDLGGLKKHQTMDVA